MSEGQLVVFRLGAEEYAVNIEQVREIINYVPVTKLPKTPPYFEGIINVRGKIVPVVNLAAKLGLAGEPAKQIIIVETGGREVGVTVDGVTEVIQTVGENFAKVEDSQSTGVVYKTAERIIMLLDIEKVLLDTAA